MNSECFKFIPPFTIFCSLLLWFAEFGEDACSALWVQECNHHVFSTWTWSLIDEAQTLCVALSQCVGHSVFYSECYVVNTASAVLKEFGNCTLRACWLKEFEFYFAYLQESGLYFLVSYFFYCVALQSQCVLEIRENFVDALDCDAKVINT